MRLLALSFAIILGTTTACARGPQPIALGDSCNRCHMTVADERWGAELITITGVIRKYDSVECLARDVIDEVIPAQDIASLWVVPWDAPGTLVQAQDAIYRRASAMRGPMGEGIAAFRRESGAQLHSTQSGDSVLNWDEVLALVSAAPEIPRHAHEPDRAR